MTMHTEDQLKGLVRELVAAPAETEWFEFKLGNFSPDVIGTLASSLSNSARIHGKDFGYVVWGVDDATHAVVGTNFDPAREKKGNESLITWLGHVVHPQVHLEFEETDLDGVRVVVLSIERAKSEPVKFSGKAYVRVGSSNRELDRNVGLQRRLWRSFDDSGWEHAASRERVSEQDLLAILDYPAYFQLMGQPLPEDRVGIVAALRADRIVQLEPGGLWSVTNMGAVLFARELSQFPNITRKGARVIRYNGTDRLGSAREQVGGRGYAAGFEGLIDYLNAFFPPNEAIGTALRTETPLYPPIAIRELVANALVHQDFTVSGAGPIIEVFDDRVEISNPGAPIVDFRRLVDTPPRSRNETLASLMRRAGICEERGTGWDKVAFQVELYQLPAPEVVVSGETTRVTLLSPRLLKDLSADERAQAVYLHACLNYVSRQDTTNSSVRKRFGIEERNKATASRLLKDAVARGLIAPYDPDASPKLMRYVPFWHSAH